MYIIEKSKGYDAPITVRNTEKNTQLNLGKANVSIVTNLKERYPDNVPENDTYHASWRIETEDKTFVNKLINIARINKTNKIPNDIKVNKTINANINAEDVLFGIAKYK